MANIVEEKKILLLNLKKETLNQLSAVSTENPEQFLLSTELCDKLIDTYNAMEIQSNPTTDNSNSELRGILLEIAQIREQISNLIPPLYEKLRKKYVAEKQRNIAKNRYKNEDIPIPSIFLDKKI